MSFIQDLLDIRTSPSPDEKYCTIIVKVRKFSNLFIHSPGETSEKFIDYDVSCDYLKYHYPVTVYPNGRDSDNGGAVAIAFTKYYLRGKFIFNVQHMELSGVIAVIDSEGSRRYIQSFVIYRDFSVPNPDPDLIVDDYISRSVLQKNPSEWLPEDTLTLHIDVVLRQSYLALSFWEIEFYQSLDEDFKTEETADSGEDGPMTRYLSLDSYFAERLSQESRYFERLMVTPMTEKSSGWVRIPGEEYQQFITIGRILFDGGPIIFESIDEIFDLYVMADKNGIDIVLQTCRCWLRLCLTPETVSEISEFADEYNDSILRETIEHFTRSEDEKRGDESIHDQVGIQSRATNRVIGEEWVLDRVDSEFGPRFEFRLNDGEENQKYKEKDSFAFYS